MLGNLPKLGLSIASILYDIIFLLQHFVFYPESSHKSPEKSTTGSTSPTKDINLSRRSTLKEAGDSQDALCSMSSSSRSSIQSTNSTASTSSSSETPPQPPPPPGFVVKSIASTGEHEKDSKTTISGHPTNLDLSSHLDAIHLRSTNTTTTTTK